MTFLSFMKKMIGDDLLELGFTYAGTERTYHGPVWYKLIDNCIFMLVNARKLSYGLIEICFCMDSLFSPCYENAMFRHSVAWIAEEHRLAIGGEDKPLGFLLLYSNGPEEETQRLIEHGKSAFALIKPLLASVLDFESCFNAKQKAGYMERFITARKWFGSEYTIDDYAEWPPIHAYCLLCAMGKYDKAADYILKEIALFEKVQSKVSDGMRLIQEHKEEWEPYLKMAQNHEAEKIHELMRKTYLANCDMLDVKLKIRVDRDAGLARLAEST